MRGPFLWGRHQPFATSNSFVGVGAVSGAIFSWYRSRRVTDLRKILFRNTLIFSAGLMPFSPHNPFAIGVGVSGQYCVVPYDVAKPTPSNTIIQNHCSIRHARSGDKLLRHGLLRHATYRWFDHRLCIARYRRPVNHHRSRALPQRHHRPRIPSPISAAISSNANIASKWICIVGSKNSSIETTSCSLILSEVLMADPR